MTADLCKELHTHAIFRTWCTRVREKREAEREQWVLNIIIAKKNHVVCSYRHWTYFAVGDLPKDCFECERSSLPLLTVNPLIHLHQFHLSGLLVKEFCCSFYNIWQCTSYEWQDFVLILAFSSDRPRWKELYLDVTKGLLQMRGQHVKLPLN